MYTTSPSSPQERRVLLCVCDTSPDVITQTLQQFLMANECFAPHEIHVIATPEGKKHILNEHLIQKLHRLMLDHAPALPLNALRFDLSTVHVVPQSGSTANTVFSVLHDIKNIPNNRLYASVTGGCSGMAFYLGHIFSLLATGKDKLWHLVADSQLEELTVERLGKNFQSQLPAKALKNFDLCVRLMEASQNPPQLAMTYIHDHKNPNGYLFLCGERVRLTPLQSIVFAIFALARKHEKDFPTNGAMVNFAKFDLNDLAQFNEAFHLTSKTKLQKVGDQEDSLKVARSKIKEQLQKVVGEAVAKHFTIEAVRKQKGNDKNSPIQLSAPASCLSVDLPKLWSVLKPVLKRIDDESAKTKK